MSAQHFTIVSDARQKMLLITMRGHWTVEVVEQYKRAVGKAVAALREGGCARGEIAVLVDATELVAQSQDVIREYKSSLVEEDYVPRRLATVLSSSLFRRQVERIDVPNQKIFTNRHEAYAWITSSIATDEL